jgi:MFS family permease
VQSPVFIGGQMSESMQEEGLTASDRKRGRARIITTAVIGVLLFYSMMRSVQVLFANKIGASPAVIGGVYSIYFLFSIVQIFAARWIQAYGKKKFLLPAYFINSAAPVILIMVPFVYRAWGTGAAVAAMSLTYVVYAISGQTAVSGWFPLIYDNVEEDKRGQFFGVMRTCWQISSICYLVFIAFFLGKEAEFSNFQIVFAIGMCAGMMRIVLIRRTRESPPDRQILRFPVLKNLALPFKHRHFKFILIYVFTISFGFSMLFAFVPYMTKNWLHFQDRFTMLFCEVGFLVGSIASVYLWGYLSDRFGSRPVYFLCNGGMVVTFLLWFFVEPDHTYVYFLIGGIIMLSGVFRAGFNLAYIRNAMGTMPRRHAAIFLAATSMCMHLASGLGPIAGGLIIEHFRFINLRRGFFSFDEYKLLVVVAMMVVAAGLVVRQRIREEGSARTKDFLLFFFSRFFRLPAIPFLYLKTFYDSRISTNGRSNRRDAKVRERRERSG